MKRNMLIKTLGTVTLLVSICITGCHIKVEEDDEDDDDKRDLPPAEEVFGDLSGCISADENWESECYYCHMQDHNFQSTNGELPGQLDYMTLVPPCDSIDWDSYETCFISDLSVIENDDIRAIAEEYASEGFDIVDPSQDREYGLASGDGEYMFTNGFNGEHFTEDAMEYIHVYEMNEDLFEYYFVEPYPNTECSDDGTVIRYTADGYVAEYNRDTGIGFLYTGRFF